MYKFKLFLIFILIINLLMPICTAKDNLYEAGILFYKQGKYNDALKFFSDAIKENSNNESCIYYFASSLEKTNNIDYAIEYYKKVIDMFPKTTFAEYAKLDLLRIRRNLGSISSPKSASFNINGQLITASNSYVDKLRGKTIWSSDRMPLKVFIAKAKLTEFESTVWESFKSWEAESYNLLSFRRISDPVNADIIVSWDNTVTNYKNAEMGGITNLSIANGVINKVEIFLVDKDQLGSFLTLSDIKSSSMFNIGRAVGINGNSDSKLDVMYPSYGKKDLTRRDKNTLALIYKSKDITLEKPPEEESSSDEVIEIKRPKKKKDTDKEKTIDNKKESNADKKENKLDNKEK